MPSNIYIARFLSQYPGSNHRFFNISASRLLQDLNCYSRGSCRARCKYRRPQHGNGGGIYSAPSLQPGSYELLVSKTGFNKIERKGLTLEVGRTLTIDFALAVESGNQTVSITAETPVVDTDKTEVSQEVSQNLVNNLPIVGRRWDNFVLLTPGTTADGGLVSYRGISGLYNNNSVDGANNNQAFFSEA